MASTVATAWGVKDSPTCEATTAWPKGRVTTGSVRSSRPVSDSIADTSSGPIIQGSGIPRAAKAAPPQAAAR